MKTPRQTPLLSLVLFLAFLAPALADSFHGKVVAVYDGDTITVLENRTQHKIRLHGIDTPERGQDFGTRSKQALSGLVFGSYVQVEVLDKDRYGREIGMIHYDGQNVNLWMLRNGWAWHYKKYDKSPEFAAAEVKARQEGLGLWRGKEPTPPWEWRARQQAARAQKKAEEIRTADSDKETATAGDHWLNTKSGVRHNAGCRWFKKTSTGRLCGPDTGEACGICGG